MTRFKNLFIATLGAFALAAPASAQVLINEVDADTPGTDMAEFVELYNAGGSMVDLAADNYVLVFFNGSNDQSYFSVDLGGTIAPGGYYVVGNATVTGVNETFADNSLQNGADGVGLYMNSDAATDFPNGTAPSMTNLVDAVVYGTADADATGLLTGLGVDVQTDESANGDSANESSQRTPDGGGGALTWGSNHVITLATPNAANPAPPTTATLQDAYVFDSGIVAVFDTDPGGVTEGDFTLTEDGSGAVLIGIAGTGNTRTLVGLSALASNSTLDNLAVAATTGTNAGNVDFYIYPPVSLIQDGTIAEDTIVGIRATVTAVPDVANPGAGSTSLNFAVATAAGANNGIFIDDDGANAPVIGNVVEVSGTVSEGSSGLTRVNAVSNYQDNGAGTAIAATMIPFGDFLAANMADMNPAEQYEGVFIQINSTLTNATDAGFGETLYNEGVKSDDLFIDTQTLSPPGGQSNPALAGIGYFSFGEYKVAPFQAAQVPVELSAFGLE